MNNAEKRGERHQAKLRHAWAPRTCPRAAHQYTASDQTGSLFVNQGVPAVCSSFGVSEPQQFMDSPGPAASPALQRLQPPIARCLTARFGMGVRAMSMAVVNVMARSEGGVRPVSARLAPCRDIPRRPKRLHRDRSRGDRCCPAVLPAGRRASSARTLIVCAGGRSCPSAAAVQSFLKTLRARCTPHRSESYCTSEGITPHRRRRRVITIDRRRTLQLRSEPTHAAMPGWCFVHRRPCTAKHWRCRRRSSIVG